MSTLFDFLTLGISPSFLWGLLYIYKANIIYSAFGCFGKRDFQKILSTLLLEAWPLLKKTKQKQKHQNPPWLLRMDLFFFLYCSVLLSVACSPWLSQSLLRKLEFRVYTRKVGIFVLITGCIPDPSCLSHQRPCWPLILSVLTLASCATLGKFVVFLVLVSSSVKWEYF